MPGFITFLTDFGLQDDFVGTCHGVIKTIAPDVQIIDVTHGVRPGGILQGALALQVRAGDEHLVAAADHGETRRRVEAERAAVAAVGGGCLAPVAAHHDGTTLVALIAAEDGSWIERRSGDDPVALGHELLRLAQR